MLSRDLEDVPPHAREAVIGLYKLIFALQAVQALQFAKGGDVAFTRPVADLIKQ